LLITCPLLRVGILNTQTRLQKYYAVSSPYLEENIMSLRDGEALENEVE